MAFITHDKTLRNISQGCIYAGRSNSLVHQEIFCGICKSNVVGLCYYISHQEFPLCYVFVLKNKCSLTTFSFVRISSFLCYISKQSKIRYLVVIDHYILFSLSIGIRFIWNFRKKYEEAWKSPFYVIIEHYILFSLSIGIRFVWNFSMKEIQRGLKISILRKQELRRLLNTQLLYNYIIYHVDIHI